MDDDANFPVTPPNASETADNDDLESLPDFNFDAPAAPAPEAAYFEDYAAAPEKSRMPRNIRELGILLNRKRRAAIQSTARGAATAWIDQDESGTYDPKRKRATPQECPPKKVKRQRLPEEFDEDGNSKPCRHYHPVGYGFPMTFVFKTEKALNYLRSITPGPFGSQSSNADDELSDSSTDSDSSYGSFPKLRKKAKQPKRLGASSVRANGLTIDQLTIGHPQRRGCKACFEAGDDECTLIQHEFDYPCQACEDAEIDCELIIPPELKKSCERCKKKRRTCSYRGDGGKGVDTCKECEYEGVTCCAGPLKDSSYSRRYDSDTSRTSQSQRPSAPFLETPGGERMYVACNQCRDAGKRCSLKGKQSQGPCTCCRKISEQCKFVLPRTRNRPVEDPILSTRLKQYTTKPSKRSQYREYSTTPPLRKRDGTPYTPTSNSRTLLSEAAQRQEKKDRRALKKGRSLSHSTFSKSQSTAEFDHEPELIGYTLGHRHIFKTTAFCHPIKFNYEPDPMGKEPCSWCASPFFGLYGLADDKGPRTVEGFYWPDGNGFEEVFGGYSEDGYSQSKMCVSCTSERVQIIACPMHHIRPLSVENGEFNPKVWDDKAWYAAGEALKHNDDEGGALILNAKWCSICPNLAKFKCTTKQDLNISISEGEDGCGLLLCGECRELMGKCVQAGFENGKMVMDAMIGEVERNRLLYWNGVRADAEFLTSEGELMFRIGQGMGCEEVEGEEEVVEVKGKGMGMLEAPYLKRGGGENLKGKGKEVVSHGAERGWINDQSKEVTFGAKIEVDIAERMSGAGGGVGRSGNVGGMGTWRGMDEVGGDGGIGSVKQRKAINYGEEVKASGKGKEKSRFLGGEVKESTEVIELSDDD